MIIWNKSLVQGIIQAVTMQDTSLNMTQSHLPHKMPPFNKTVLNGVPITQNDIDKFVKFMHAFQKKNMSTQVDECQGYCQGEIYNWLRAYNSIHGYVSLMVSARSKKTQTRYSSRLKTMETFD